MKLTSKILAGVFAAAVMASAAVSVSAIDYSDDPSYGEPTYGDVVTDEDIADAIEKAGSAENVTIEVVTGAELTKKAVADLQAANKGLEVVAEDYSIEISAEELKKIDGAVDLTVAVTDLTDDTTLANKVSIPKDSVMINPALSGEFGFTMKVTIAKANLPAGVTSTNAKLYYVADDGKITAVEDGITWGADGEATISINHASYYVISAGEVKSTAGGDDGKGDTPATGVMLPIALVALAGGAVAVSAVAAKKRK